ncbi:uncharacterized protein RJT20DRAFT_128625 [Scheffersomyces xylosifermentans]|uniref:uncharacterized protein n=1 Tax=Scheffersomyces xylosifermentans TaxID=1304137 RepID=UPI00315CEE0B
MSMNSAKSPVSTSSTPADLSLQTGFSAGTPGTQPIPKKSQQIKTDKPRPHVCTICTRAFARLEHLKRHERSHTNEKPFQCAACGRCFARRDLVLRHQQKLHTTLPNIMRRGSSVSGASSNGMGSVSGNNKDIDSNEHIIVLHNNTSPNAPLPSGALGDFDINGNNHHTNSNNNHSFVGANASINGGHSFNDKGDDSDQSSIYPYSPPKSNNHSNNFNNNSHLNGNGDIYSKPQFRTALFGGNNNSNSNSNNNNSNNSINNKNTSISRSGSVSISNNGGIILRSNSINSVGSTGSASHQLSNAPTSNVHASFGQISSLSPPNQMEHSPLPSNHNSPSGHALNGSQNGTNAGFNGNGNNTAAANSNSFIPSPQSNGSPHKHSISAPRPIPPHLQSQNQSNLSHKQVFSPPNHISSSKSTPTASHEPIANRNTNSTSAMSMNPQVNNLAQQHQQYRHVSFSAASNVSYANLKDALNIQHSNNFPEVSQGQVEFATPQLSAHDDFSSRNLLLSGLDLSSYNMIDWNNIENFDLNDDSGANNGIGSNNGSSTNLTARQKSIKNLQQFFLENVHSTGGQANNNNPLANSNLKSSNSFKNSNGHALSLPSSMANTLGHLIGIPNNNNGTSNNDSGNKNDSNLNSNSIGLAHHTSTDTTNDPSDLPSVIASHQFSNPSHPHHIKGTTPFEFGVNPPNDFTMMQSLLEQNGLNKEPANFNLNSNQLDERKTVNRQKKKPSENSQMPPNKKVKHENSTNDRSSTESINTPATTLTTNMGMPISITNNEDDNWLKEIIGTPYDANFQQNNQNLGLFDAPSLLSSPKLEYALPPGAIATASDITSGTVTGASIAAAAAQLAAMDATSISPNELGTLFRSRQNDLVNQLKPNFSLPSQSFNSSGPGGNGSKSGSASGSASAANALGGIGSISTTLGTDKAQGRDMISAELRTRIITMSSVSEAQFPCLEDLNAYMRLYELEFNKYFPFIHLPSLKNPLVDNIENIPLLLSMASIGALYSFHDAHTLLLFNLSKFHIQSFFEKEITLDNLQFKKVPLMAHQCLVLHIFISMFLNEANMVDITSRQIKSMIGLIKSTNFNEPLEQFLVPPPSILETVGNTSNSNRSTQLIQNNFDYFIMAQSRIRTLHMFYMLQTFRSSLIGLPIYLSSKFLKSGNHCYNEELWRCETSVAWFEELSKAGYVSTVMQEESNKDNDKNKGSVNNGSKRSLVELSNGDSLDSLLKSFKDNTFKGYSSFHVGSIAVAPTSSSLSLNNLLSVLMYLHEQTQTAVLTSNQPFTYLNWKLNHKPKLDRAVKAWEASYLSHGGVLHIDSYNRHLLNSRNELKLILPLYALLKIKLEINFNAVVSPILRKDWTSMNSQLNLMLLQEGIHENIRFALPYCFEIIQLWIYNIETINYDIKQTSLRTPVFFVACLFVAVTLVSTYLDHLEGKFEKRRKLTDKELVDWLGCESIMLKVEKVLSPVLKSSYSELLTKQAHGAFNSIIDDKAVHNIGKLIEKKEVVSRDIITSGDTKEKLDRLDNISGELTEEIKKINLSTKSLYLGIRILADAPVWPIAMGFAEALKNRATYLSTRKRDMRTSK